MANEEKKITFQSDSYYGRELGKLNLMDTLSIQVSGEGNATKWLSLNKESIKELRAFLDTYEMILPD